MARTDARSGVLPPRAWPLAMLAVVAIFALKTSYLALVFTPLWDIPDETAHYDYIADLAEGELQPDGLDSIDEHLVDDWTDERERPVPNWIAGQHPPLYHLAALPAYFVAQVMSDSIDSQVRIVRLVNVVLGSVTILMLFRAMRLAFGRPDFAFLVAASLSVTPMFTHLSAGVTHDVAVALGSTVAFCFLARALQTGSTSSILLAAGAVSMTGAIKITAILLLPAVVVTAWWIPAHDPRSRLIRSSIAGAIAAVVPAAWIILLNILQTDPVRSLEGISLHEILLFVSGKGVIEETVRSFFGVLGWYGTGTHRVIPITGFVYMPYLLVTTAAALLTLGREVQRRARESHGIRSTGTWLPVVGFVVAMAVVFRGLGPVGFVKQLLVSALAALGIAGLTARGSDPQQRLVMVSRLSIAAFLTALVVNSWIATNFWGSLAATHGRYAYVILPFLAAGVLWGAFRWWIDHGLHPTILLAVPAVLAVSEVWFLTIIVAPAYG